MSATTESDGGRASLPRPSQFATTLHHFRTEGMTPTRQAFAVGIGLYIGATPFLGFHFLITMVVGRLLGLNRILMYAAANISNPFVAPLLYAMEIQLGVWIRTGQVYSLSALDEIRLQGLAIDILVGSVIVGLVLGAIGTVLTYSVVRARGLTPTATRLVDAAAARYLPIGAGTWEFARGKVRHDPVYLGVLQDGVLPSQGKLLDLGCGSGLMLSLLAAAREQFARGDWPAGWPAPPSDLALHGIELRPKAARHAREVLRDVATIEERDLVGALLPTCDAVVVFDVFHLMTAAAQDQVLAEIAHALRPKGVFVLREANPAGGWRFQMVRLGNRLVAILHGRYRHPFQFRSVDEWIAKLRALGFTVRLAETPNRTPFANITLYAVKPEIE
jgi:uncharacterized protein (DUF2062 family)/2-polyprenyl-3-methyl-5-hydroxy-6-metoxy-1,4-benzoquinol methylase